VPVIPDSLSAQSLLDVMQRFDLFGIVQISNLQFLLQLFDAVVRERNRLRFLVQRVVLIRNHARNDLIHSVVFVGGVVGGTRDDEGRARFVDQDRVHLVDDGEVELALDIVLEPELHVVA
jgi:hypothetical protein